jgi:5-methylcytosine-specific restriction endonuclease McrA
MTTPLRHAPQATGPYAQQLRDEIRAQVAELLRVIDRNAPLLGGPFDDDTVGFGELAVRAFAEELGYVPVRTRVSRHLSSPWEPPRELSRRKEADRAIGKAFRRIGERDGFYCRTCGIGRNLTVDHILAVANGGTDEDDNLQILCRSHNSAKGTR